MADTNFKMASILQLDNYKQEVAIIFTATFA